MKTTLLSDLQLAAYIETGECALTGWVMTYEKLCGQFPTSMPTNPWERIKFSQLVFKRA
jgi:hypothetical protein